MEIVLGIIAFATAFLAFSFRAAFYVLRANAQPDSKGAGRVKWGLRLSGVASGAVAVAFLLMLFVSARWDYVLTAVIVFGAFFEMINTAYWRRLDQSG